MAMFLKSAGRRSFGFPLYSTSQGGGLNMTPVIDIVFLLIIFFLVVCRFIEAENFPVCVPDNCGFARRDAEPGAQMTTVTVTKAGGESVTFAVGSQKISTSRSADNVVEELSRLIDARLRDLPAERRVVTLRVDRDVCFAEAQYALAGVAASSATDIQLATLRDKRTTLP